MQNLKFKMGDIITVADPGDKSGYYKGFYKIVGTLPVPEGFIPYSIKSLQIGMIYGPPELNTMILEMIKVEEVDGYKFIRTIVPDTTTPIAYFESCYKVLTEQEKLIYTNE